MKIPSIDQIDVELSSDEDERQAERWEVKSLVHKKNQNISTSFYLLQF